MLIVSLLCNITSWHENVKLLATLQSSVYTGSQFISMTQFVTFVLVRVQVRGLQITHALGQYEALQYHKCKDEMTTVSVSSVHNKYDRQA